MEKEINGATALAYMLSCYEVRYIFGIPGDTNTEFHAGLAQFPSIRYVLARDERGAGYMADAYARISNRPGVVDVPAGGGPLYAIASIAESHLSQIPVLLITSDIPLYGEGRGFITDVDCVRIFEAVTKASIQVKSATMIPEIVRRAFRIATSGRPGAVQICVPEDIYRQCINTSEVSFHIERSCMTYPAYAAEARHDDLLALRNLIASCRRPVIVAGGGVNRARGQQALTRVAEQYGIPVVTTITGQNVIPDSHELAIGNIGDNGFHPHANRALEECDLMIYAGCKVGSTMTMGWTFPAPDPRRTIAQIDIDPEVLGNNTDNALSIAADARLTFEAFSALPLPEKMSIDPNWVPNLNAWRKMFWQQTFAELKELATDPDLTPIPAELVIDALGSRLKKPHLIISDPGTPTPYLCRLVKLDDGTSRMIFQRALGSLGYAIPAVVGAWFANPELRPIGLFGDGSLGMAVGDLRSKSAGES
jgi:acetolactate synthase-1/2/3 large subunit